MDLDLKGLSAVVEFTPEDMTVTVETGISLGTLQHELALRGQWLPIDPPAPESLSLHQLLSQNLSGPRRYGYGTIREHLIGLKVVLADGRVIKSGGKVVKNVAGYDLAKLFIGARDSLGVIAEATFKLRPLPEDEQFVEATVLSPTRAGEVTGKILESQVTPVVLDWHNQRSGSSADSVTVVLGFAGTREEVHWQMNEARGMGFSQSSNLDHEKSFWSQASAAAIHRISSLPSKLGDELGKLGRVSMVARAGNGLVYYRAGPVTPQNISASMLAQRVKQSYDPKNILPEI